MNTKFENLDKLFELYVAEAVKKNKEKYNSHEALENDLGLLFEKFENTKVRTLDGKTPKEYVRELQKNRELTEYVSTCLDENVEVTDTVCDALITDPDATEYLTGLLYEQNPDANMLGVKLLAEKAATRSRTCLFPFLPTTKYATK